MPARDVAAGKPGASRAPAREAEGLALICISCSLRDSGSLLFSWTSYFTSCKNGKFFDCCRATQCTLKDKNKAPQQSHSNPHPQCQFTGPHDPLQQPRNLDGGHSVLLCPTQGWLSCTSDTKSNCIPFSGSRRQQTSRAATQTSQRGHQLTLGMPTVLSRMSTVLSRQDTIRQPAPSEGSQRAAKPPGLFSVKKLLWNPARVPVTNKPGAESTKQ